MYCTGGEHTVTHFHFKCRLSNATSNHWLWMNQKKGASAKVAHSSTEKSLRRKICWLAERFHSQQSENQDCSSSMYFNELPVNPNNSWNIKAAQVLWFSLCTLWSVIHSLALKSLRNKAELWCYPLITAVWNKPNVGNQTVWLSRGERSATQNHLGFSVRCSQWLVWTLWSLSSLTNICFAVCLQEQSVRIVSRKLRRCALQSHSTYSKASNCVCVCVLYNMYFYSCHSFCHLQATVNWEAAAAKMLHKYFRGNCPLLPTV